MGYTGAMNGLGATAGRLVLAGSLALLATAVLHPLGCGGTAVLDHDDSGAGGGTATGTSTSTTTSTGTGSGSRGWVRASSSMGLTTVTGVRRAGTLLAR